MQTMKQKTLFSRLLATLVLAAVVVLGIALAVRQSSPSAPSGRLAVSASYYPLYDFAKQVGGNRVTVADLTPSGVEPHDYEPSPKTLADARKSEVFIYNGIIEPWADSFVADYENVTVKASTGIAQPAGGHDHEEHGNLDPHFWLDPVLAQQIVAEIRDAFIRADPEGKTYYMERSAAYIDRLKDLDAAFRTGLSQCGQHSIVASHDAFSYVARRYGFTVRSIAGLNPEAEPSPAHLAELSDYVRQNNIKYVFFEQLVSSRLADTIAQETGAQTSVLNPIEGLTNEDQSKGRDYLSIQRENLGNLRAALACN